MSSPPLNHHHPKSGLLSPNLSFGSLSSSPHPSTSNSSTSISSLSLSAAGDTNPYHLSPAPHTPRTPLRSAHLLPPGTPRTPSSSRPPAALYSPSPLLRLLQPFSPLAGPSNHLSRPSSPTMSMTVPTPHYSQPPSPTSASHPPQPQHSNHPKAGTGHPAQGGARSSSRSERMLRDTLLRDDLERSAHVVPPVPVSPSPLASASPTTKAHRRRHSHIPTTVHSNQDPGSFFRTPPTATASKLPAPAQANGSGSSNPNPASPPLSASARSHSTTRMMSPQGAAAMYGGDREGSVPSTPLRNPQFAAQQQQYLHQSQQQQRLRSASRDVSPSPSGLRRSLGGHHRPSPLPLEFDSRQHHSSSQAQNGLPPKSAGANLQRHRSATSTRYQSRDQSPSRRNHRERGEGEPLVMTPHEQVLRARLERVLAAGKVREGSVDVETAKENDNERERRRRERRERQERSGSPIGLSASTSGYSNEVRDEEGGWPWREREREMRSAGSASNASSPQFTSGSGSSKSNSGQNIALAAAPTSAAAAYAYGYAAHHRSRSKTDPIPPKTAPVGGHPSPRRSTTAPTPHSNGATSPILGPALVAEALAIVGDADGDDEDSSSSDLHNSNGYSKNNELRLLTPPPTPPVTARIFSFGGASHSQTLKVRGGPVQGEYCPSPYKKSFAEAGGYATTRRAPPAGAGAGMSGLGPARRPMHSPVHHRSSEEHSPEHDQYPDESSSCSSRSFPHSPGSGSSNSHLAEPPLSPVAPVQPHLGFGRPRNGAPDGSPSRPHFNARKASERCRAMEGYVSFANVEGLGEPPADDPLSPDARGSGQGDHERGRTGAVEGVFAWGVGGFRRLLGVGDEGKPVVL